MTPERREQIEKRWREIDDRLADLAAGEPCPVPGVDVEFYRGELLLQLDELEYEIGVDYFKDRK